MRKTPRTRAQTDDGAYTMLLPVGAPSPPPEPDAGRLARGRVQKGRIAKSDGLSRSDGFQSKKGDFTGSPIFEVKSAVPLDDDLAMVSTKSQGAAARVLLALPPEGAELPVIADPPMTADPPLMFHSEEEQKSTKSSMSKRLTSLKASLRSLPLFPHKPEKAKSDEESLPPKRQGRLHAGPTSPKNIRSEDPKPAQGMALAIDQQSLSASKDGWGSPSSPKPGRVPSRDLPSPPSTSRFRTPSKEAPSPSSSGRMQPPPPSPPSSPSPPSPTRVVKETGAPASPARAVKDMGSTMGSPMGSPMGPTMGPTLSHPSSPSKARAQSKEERKPVPPSTPSKAPNGSVKDGAPSPVRRLSQLCVRGWTQGKKDDVAEILRKDEDWEQQERVMQYQDDLKTALELQARGQAIELKPMTAAEEKEQLELERQIQENGLAGKDALAFLLSAKLGSLDDAFQYMDTANRGDSFAFVSWHTGLLVLRIDPNKIAGMSVKQSFQRISQGKSEISKAAWEEYFADWDDSAFTGKRRRRQALKPKLPQVPKVEKPPEPPPPEKPPTPEKKPEVNKLKKATMKLALLSRLQKEEEEEDEETIRGQAMEELSSLHPDQSVKLSNLSRKKRAIHLQVARELNLWSSQGSSLLVMREGPISQKLRQDVLELPLCSGIRLRAKKAGPGLVLLGRTLAEAENLRISKAIGPCPNATQELVLPKFSLAARSLVDVDEEDGYDVDIFNDRGSAPEVEEVLRSQLADLPLKAMYEFPAAVGQDFRDCAVRVCKEYGYDIIGVSGFQERVVVGNLKESVRHLHAELAEGVQPGFVQFSNDISRLEKEVIRREARLKGYIVVEDEAGLRVSRMSEAPTTTKEEGPLKELCKLSAEVFAQYATGRAGVHIYMRRGDLAMMLRDVPPDRAEVLAKPLYEAFDDTLHLQIELTKASNGLSKQFFKVFLDKAMQQAGWYPSPEVLEALHKREEEGGDEDEYDAASDEADDVASDS